MTNVLIRDVPVEDLDRIRAAAAEQGASLQSYLRDAVHAQAAYLRRRDALARTGLRLHDREPVRPDDRAAVLAAVDEALAERAEQLGEARQ
ncbi:MAG TPA: hypothetical protein VGH01_11545 [Jatrophihabitantaceae bacterium]